MATAFTIGAVVASLPEDCVITSVGAVTYEHCGTTWFRPEYIGTEVQYVVVDQP